MGRRRSCLQTHELAIELSNVGVYRGGQWILRGINWRVPAGACVAILGHNGSGKSTLARIIACHLYPSEGVGRILGRQFGQCDLTELRKEIRLLQPAGPYDIDGDLTALEVVLTGQFATLRLYDAVTTQMKEEARRLLDRVGLRAVAEHRYDTLSSGERVRALIARALAKRPRILLLDEPTAGLDILAREQVLATIQTLFEPGHWRPTVILITHHVEELPPATSRVLLLAKGTVAAAGTTEEVLREGILSRAYGCPVQVRQSGGRYYLEVHPSAWEDLIGADSPRGSAAL